MLNVIREIKEVNADYVQIRLPKEFKKKRLEIIVFPLEEVDKKTSRLKGFNLTTYKCFGKKRDFTRDDAYDDRK